jgi:hypothetical protein
MKKNMTNWIRQPVGWLCRKKLTAFRDESFVEVWVFEIVLAGSSVAFSAARPTSHGCVGL